MVNIVKGARMAAEVRRQWVSESIQEGRRQPASGDSECAKPGADRLEQTGRGWK